MKHQFRHRHGWKCVKCGYFGGDRNFCPACGYRASDEKADKSKPQHIEMMAMSKSLPVNSKVMIRRLKEIMDLEGTNCLTDIRNDWRVRSTMWLLMSQVFGQLAKIDMGDLWDELYAQYNSEEVPDENVPS